MRSEKMSLCNGESKIVGIFEITLQEKQKRTSKSIKKEIMEKEEDEKESSI